MHTKVRGYTASCSDRLPHVFSFQWSVTHNDNTIQNGGRYTMTYEPVSLNEYRIILQISDVVQSDSGILSLHVQVGPIDGRCDFQLTVKSK